MTAERQAREANMAIACNNSKHAQASVTHAGACQAKRAPFPMPYLWEAHHLPWSFS